MTTAKLLWFGLMVAVTVPFLLWRMMRAEDGAGFMPFYIHPEVRLILLSAILQAFALACFVFALLMLIS
jgi:hypothetical protein